MATRVTDCNTGTPYHPGFSMSEMSRFDIGRDTNFVMHLCFITWFLITQVDDTDCSK